MFIGWLTIVANLMVILMCGPTALNNTKEQAKMRNLSLYEKSGPYTIELKHSAKERAGIEAKIREFLWYQWRQRHLGQVTVTQFSKEGEQSISSYFVEPDESGAWHVYVKIDRKLIDRGEAKSQFDESIEYTAYILDRIEIPKDRLTPHVVIPREDIREPQKYRLTLKDKNGKVIIEI